MPLDPTGQVGTPDADKNAIGFWMIVKGARPVAPVRVLVTFEALGEMDPCGTHMLPSRYSTETAPGSKKPRAISSTPEVSKLDNIRAGPSSCAWKT